MSMLRKLGNALRNVKVDDIYRSCSVCKENIKQLETDGLQDDEIIFINPDYNCSGFVVAHHICVIKKAGIVAFAEKTVRRMDEAKVDREDSIKRWSRK